MSEEEPLKVTLSAEIRWTGPLRASVFNYSEESRERNAAYLRVAVETGFPLRDEGGRVPRMQINVSVYSMMEEIRDRIDRVLMEGMGVNHLPDGHPGANLATSQAMYDFRWNRPEVRRPFS